VHNPHAEAHQLYTPVWHGKRDPLVVSHLDLGIRTEGARKLTYFNSQVTNKSITDMNAACPTECGRVRRKIGSERHGVLRDRGYSLERNFGCGNRHTAGVFSRRAF